MYADDNNEGDRNGRQATLAAIVFEITRYSVRNVRDVPRAQRTETRRVPLGHSELEGPLMQTTFRLLPRREVESMTGLSRTSIYRLMRLGQFPEPVRVGPKAVRWSEEELVSWLASRPKATGQAAA